MAEHLKVRVHVASITLIYKSIVVCYTFYFFASVNNQKNIRVYLFRFYFNDL